MRRFFTLEGGERVRERERERERERGGGEMHIEEPIKTGRQTDRKEEGAIVRENSSFKMKQSRLVS